MSSNGGRSVIVTGVASGIGRAIADRLVGDGLDVLAVDLAPAGDTPPRPSRPATLRPSTASWAW
jgi:NAD(P)-dependent dehydrogenase (short-subunit alcohol dehydrogenase family)